MLWKTLLQSADETLVSAWVGGGVVRRGARAWAIEGARPAEHGWWSFRLAARSARFEGAAAAAPEGLGQLVRGFLVGDRLVRDDARIPTDPGAIARAAERVHLLDPGLDRFVRVCAGRAHEGGPLVFAAVELPLGPEDDVLSAFLALSPDDALATVESGWARCPLVGIRGVPPALDAAFRLEVARKAEAHRRRLAIARRRAELEEEARRAQAHERRNVEALARVGDGATRRAMARVDFDEAARAALAASGAELLDHRPAYVRGERIVRFRFDGRRFECTCDERTLRIVDAGICLVDHQTGIKGDARFTLESLPAVIHEADRTDRLVVFRHAE
jgi:hypothetical protein